MRSMVPWRNILSTECFLNYLLKTTSVFLWLNWKCCISNITVLWKYGSNPSCCRYVNWWIKLRDLKPLYYTWNLCFYLNIEGFSAFSSKCEKITWVTSKEGFRISKLECYCIKTRGLELYQHSREISMRKGRWQTSYEKQHIRFFGGETENILGNSMNESMKQL